MSDFTTFNSDTFAKTTNFSDFQNKAIDYLYDMSIADDSQFLGIISKTKNNSDKEIESLRYLIQKVSYTTPSFKSERDEGRRLECISGYEGNNKINVSFYEDSKNSIEKVVLSLMGTFFNFSNGCFKSLKSDEIPKYNLDVYRFFLKEDKEGKIFPIIHSRLRFNSIIPLKAPNIELDSTAGSDMKIVDVEFLFGNCEYSCFDSNLENNIISLKNLN